VQFLRQGDPSDRLCDIQDIKSDVPGAKFRFLGSFIMKTIKEPRSHSQTRIFSRSPSAASLSATVPGFAQISRSRRFRVNQIKANLHETSREWITVDVSLGGPNPMREKDNLLELIPEPAGRDAFHAAEGERLIPSSSLHLTSQSLPLLQLSCLILEPSLS
jgi:hypothetical protein